MTDCAAPRHDEPEPAAPHAVLCHPCTARLRSDLRRLPSLHAMLAGLLDPRRATGPGTGDGGGLPYHEPASEAMSQITHDAGYWVALVLAERQPDAWPVRALAVMCGWLAGQVTWCSFRPWAGDMAGAFAADASAAWAVLNPRPRAVIALPPGMNWCPGCHERGRLTAVVPQSDGDRRPSMVECGACEAQWDTTQWLRLGQQIIRHHDAERAVFGTVEAA